MPSKCVLFPFRLEDYDAEEEDEEALIEQRRQQRLAIVQVSNGKQLVYGIFGLGLAMVLSKDYTIKRKMTFEIVIRVCYAKFVKAWVNGFSENPDRSNPHAGSVSLLGPLVRG